MSELLIKRLDAPMLYRPETVQVSSDATGAELHLLAHVTAHPGGALSAHTAPVPIDIAYRFDAAGACTGSAILQPRTFRHVTAAPWFSDEELEAVADYVPEVLSMRETRARLYMGAHLGKVLMRDFLRCAQVLCGISPCFSFIRERRVHHYREGDDTRCMAELCLPIGPAVSFRLRPDAGNARLVLAKPLPMPMQRALARETEEAMRTHPGHFYRTTGWAKCAAVTLPCPYPFMQKEPNHA